MQKNSVFGTLKLLSISILAVLCCSGSLLAKAKPATDFSLPDINDQTVSLSSLSSYNVLFLFGSTSCPHCQDGFDLLNQLEKEIGDELQIYFIAIKQNKNQVIDYFLPDLPVKNKMIFEQSFWPSSLAF